jgi:4-hydroxythreonine-4-phosphate dehydrogenase
MGAAAQIPPLVLTPLALTMGDPAGVGGEIALRAWAARDKTTPPFFIIDDAARLAALAQQFKIAAPVVAISAASEAVSAFTKALPVLTPEVPLETPVVLGRPDSANARAVIGAIDQAVALAKSGAAGGMVTNPIHKAGLQSVGFAFPGHTEYLGHLAGDVPTIMMLAIDDLRVVPVTVHLAIKDVAGALHSELILQAARITAAALKRDFGITSPRLAVAALNPHAGEQGNMGGEEMTIIAPAIAQLKADGIDATGPAPADTLFHAAARKRYDVAMCMYHDQALIPLKTLDFSRGVNVTLGLPFVRTSPDHGTAFDIAARGVADPSSLLAALQMAGDIAARRATVKAA